MVATIRKPNYTIRPNPDDIKLVTLLHKKLGVDTSQIFRLAIRALAQKVGIDARGVPRRSRLFNGR